MLKSIKMRLSQCRQPLFFMVNQGVSHSPHEVFKNAYPQPCTKYKKRYFDSAQHRHFDSVMTCIIVG